MNAISIMSQDKLFCVLPLLHPGISEDCIRSIEKEGSSLGILPDRILVVDNSQEGFGDKYLERGFKSYRDPNGHNIGVARAWNLGAEEVITKKLDYLVIISASMYFGPVHQCTFFTQMQSHWGEKMIEADGHGWHLIAIHRSVFETIGLFDTNFYPAYFEDVDFSRRMRMVGLQGGYSKVWVNAISQGNALHRNFVDCKAQPLLEYYSAKWGGGKMEEKFDLPFGDKEIGYFPEKSIAELQIDYKLENYW